MRDTRENGDARCNGPARVDERGHGAQTLTAAHFDDADLGHHVAAAVAAGGLDVEDAERHVGEGRAEIVEGALHGKKLTTNVRSLSRTSVRSGRVRRVWVA